MADTISKRPSPTLLERLVDARRNFKPLKKSATNPRFGKPYSTLDDVHAATSAALLDAGLVFVHRVGLDTSADRLVLSTQLLDVESGESIESLFPIPEISDPQKAGIWMTYGRRYGECALLDLVADPDDDGNGATEPRKGSSGSSAGRASSGDKPKKETTDTLRGLWKTLDEEFGKGAPWEVPGKRRLLALVFGTTAMDEIKGLTEEQQRAKLNDPRTGYYASLEKVRARDQESDTNEEG